MYDLVIRNATICDGSGEPGFSGDLAVHDGLIVAVGDGIGDGKEMLDADGLVLAPGIIDNHTHYDAQLTWDAYASPSLSLGVTTLIMGNCGFTIAPCRKQDRDLTLKNLTQVEGMSLDALREGTSRDYETFEEYMDLLEGQGMVPNVAVYCGHSSIRTWVMGDAAIERVATDEEVSQMKQLVRSSVDAGAIGFASSTYQGHNGWGGVPMPSRFADDRELRALVDSLGEAGRGCFMLTKGLETDVPFLESLAQSSGRPVIVAAVLYDHSNPYRAFDDMKMIGEAVQRGNRLIGQVACTPVSMEFKLTGAYLFEGMDAWRPAISLYEDKKALAELYADTAFREAVKKELVAEGAMNRFTDQWDKFEILEVSRERHKHLEQAVVADLAAKENKHPLDWLLDFGAEEDFETLFNAGILNADEEQVLPLLKDPNASIGLADSGAHLFLFCDADFGLHLLSRWTRERRDFTLEEAVAALTSRQAATYGIQNRGLLKPGYYADLLLFDSHRIGRGQKQRLDDLPANASRLVRLEPTGIHGIWVNGTRVADEHGVRENAGRPGNLLRSFDA